MRLLLNCLLMTLALASSGCSTGGPPARPEGIQATGKILLPNGKPLSGGTLILRPESGLYGATALIQSDGTFTLQETSGNPSIVPGMYQVFVRFLNPDHAKLASTVPQRYQQSEDGDSDVYVEVLENVQNLEIRLKR